MTQLEDYFITQKLMLELCKCLDKVKLKEFIEEIDQAELSATLGDGALSRVAGIKRVAQSLLLSQEAYRELRAEARQSWRVVGVRA